jgi:acetyltransferase-like isoleucine patch superfamily enzyme
MFMRYIRALLIFLFPTYIVRIILNSDKIHIDKNVKVGFSFLICDNIILKEGTNIGHLNFIQLNSFNCGKGVYIGHLNFIRGRLLDVVLGNKVWINRQNKISVPAFCNDRTQFVVKDYAAITIGHLFDLTNSIEIGYRTAFVGVGTQVWTHSFLYSRESLKTVRVDKSVVIGNNCHIATKVVILGCKISDGITIGANSCVSKDLEKSGLYVNQPLRYIESYDPDEKMKALGVPDYFMGGLGVYHESV